MVTGAAGIFGTVSNDTITNSATLAATVLFGQAAQREAGYDVLTNYGIIIGAILLGNNDDQYWGAYSDAGSGNDTLVGGIHNDSSYGGDLDDQISGGAGDDDIVDSAGSTQVRGRGGYDPSVRR